MMNDDEQKRINDLRKAAESFSALQYVAIRTDRQWPWTSVTATNQVVDLVRAMPWLLDRLAASLAREARLTEAVGALRAKLAPEWWREDEREWYVHCSLCAAYGPRDDFWHFEDCVLGQALAAAAPAAGGQPRDGEEAAG